tara:strand:+ start:1199 stop:2173 length:975 start_codon:yes stop_codon:yes gene_type:complete
VKISETQLDAKLLKEEPNVFIILGEEPIRIQELTEQIYASLELRGFNSKDSYLVTSKMDWSFLSKSGENMDLFSNKTVIEIKMINQGPGNKGSKALKDYLSQDNENALVVLVEGLDKKTKSSAWVKALESKGLMIELQPLKGKSLYNWIINKSDELKIQMNKDAYDLLLEKTEGNLMATSQELKKLSLLFPEEEISLNKMEQSISNSSSYSIFDFSKAFLNKEKSKCLKILEQLRIEGTPETLILWSVAREVNNLYKIKLSGSSKGIWGPSFYISSLEKSSKNTEKEIIELCIKKIASIDSSIKGQNMNKPWMEIKDLTLKFIS